MTLTITPIYAAVLALIYVALAINVIRGRQRHRVLLGTGSAPDLEQRVRAHGNFAEYAPFTLLLLAMDEARGAPALMLHILCLALLLGRLSHAVSLLGSAQILPARVAGMVLTFAALVGAALGVLIR